jgi:hypothetical protein
MVCYLFVELKEGAQVEHDGGRKLLNPVGERAMVLFLTALDEVISGNYRSSRKLGMFMPKAFKLLAGGKRSATTGKYALSQYPGGMTAGIPPGCNVRHKQFRWWRFAYHRLIAAIPPGYVQKADTLRVWISSGVFESCRGIDSETFRAAMFE